MRASSLPRPGALFLTLLAILFAVLPLTRADAQTGPQHIQAQLLLVDSTDVGRQRTYALVFDPDPGWHGYWRNPGDAGLPMRLDWSWPKGWFGELRYPVPEQLTIGGLMNHVYEHRYVVLVPVERPVDAGAKGKEPLTVEADWLACTDAICVPEHATLTAQDTREENGGPDPRLAGWRAAIPPPLDRPAHIASDGTTIRIAIPLPSGFALDHPRVFVDQPDTIDYAAPQRFARSGDTLIATLSAASDAAAGKPVSGILAYGKQQGVRFDARPGAVPAGGSPLGDRAQGPGTSLALLVLAAILGGLILNVMPCVFPILSLKALSLAKAGGADAGAARRDALAYSAGVIVACLALGGLLLALRAAGSQIGWAFQLQQPSVLVVLFLLACALTANFLGAFEIPGMAIAGGVPRGTATGSFATGLLAAFVATPCTGPFMAAALGAALVLPSVAALALFAGLGLGIALPFLLLGFVPALRARLPRPGPWMDRFRRWMALPMGLTALALAWLLWRVGGAGWALVVGAIAAGLVAILFVYGRGQRRGAGRLWLLGGGAVAAVLIALVALPSPQAPSADGEASLLHPQAFSPQALADARASGHPVFVWFTADWCLTCKVNERVAIERAATAEAFRKAGVRSLRGDWTRPDPQITQFLAQQGVAGVPLYLWYDPGAQAPEQLPQVLTPAALISRGARSGARTAAHSSAASRTH